jgi:hypothetical protein
MQAKRDGVLDTADPPMCHREKKLSGPSFVGSDYCTFCVEIGGNGRTKQSGLRHGIL